MARRSLHRHAAGREELRNALAEIVETARANGWVDADKAEGWLEKLERGRVLMEGWPKYLVRLSSSGALMVIFGSTNPDNIVREAQRFRDMGLVEGVTSLSRSRRAARRATSLSLGRVLSAPRGFLYTARENNGSWRQISWSTFSRGLRRRARRFTKRSEKS
jgi:hypothetical protein